jgi:long-chain fatty acid transport protein
MRKILAAAVVLLLAPSLSFGAGFALFEAGARSFAMGGAFTAVADDPAALFWNPAGLAFQNDKGTQLMVGATFIVPTQDFYGLSPYPGDGYTTSQEDQLFPVPHLYIVTPLSDRVNFGFSVMAPFGLGTHWEDDHLGRFISKKVELEAIDLSPNLAFKLTDYLALGIGVDYRISTIELIRNVGIVDPFSQSLTDVAEVNMATDGYGNDGWGWHASALADLGAGFSFGVLYRSEVTVDYSAEATFSQYATGNPELDGLVASIFPFDNPTPGVTQIVFPDYWSIGLAWSNEKLTFSGQWALMGWSSFQSLDLIFTEYPEFNETINENYEDSDAYRLGFECRASSKIAFQLGLEYDNTPQPVEAMTPLLGDGDRTVYAAGLSVILKRFRLDMAYEYIDLETRSTGGGSYAGYEGSYAGVAHLAAVSLTWMF